MVADSITLPHRARWGWTFAELETLSRLAGFELAKARQGDLRE